MTWLPIRRQPNATPREAISIRAKAIGLHQLGQAASP
jgi:hypothetical protein